MNKLPNQTMARPVIRRNRSKTAQKRAEAEMLSQEAVQHIINRFDDASRPGMQDTPKRYIKFLDEFMRPADFELTEFDGEGYDQMIVQKDISFFSLCEHHTAPFHGVAHVAYIPNGKIVGLSKLARTVEKFASGFQNQERMTMQIAAYLMEKLKPQGVAVVVSATHLCMAMRGIKKLGAETITSDTQGVFRTDSSCKAEFFQLIK